MFTESIRILLFIFQMMVDVASEAQFLFESMDFLGYENNVNGYKKFLKWLQYLEETLALSRMLRAGNITLKGLMVLNKGVGCVSFTVINVST